MQDVLRMKLNQFIYIFGSTNSFIAKSIGVSESQISRFRSGQRNLGKRHSNKLELLLQSLT